MPRAIQKEGLLVPVAQLPFTNQHNQFPRRNWYNPKNYGAGWRRRREKKLQDQALLDWLGQGSKDRPGQLQLYLFFDGITTA